MSAKLIATRGKTHGDYDKQARLYVKLKCYLHNRPGGMRPAHVEALDMICIKLARIFHGDPNCRDHWDDIAGYAKLAADRCVTPKQTIDPSI